MKIKRLVELLNIKWNLLKFDEFKKSEREIIAKSQLSSNGLAPSKHFFYHYSALPDNTAVFEGYGGSEMFKAELSDGMWTEPYKTLITTHKDSRKYLEEYFSGLSEKHRKQMSEHICGDFCDYFSDINTPQGYEMHRQYILDLIPARVFNGVFNSALYLGHTLYQPFFSRSILTSYCLVKHRLSDRGA